MIDYGERVRAKDYGSDALRAGRGRRPVTEIAAEPGLVVEEPVSGFCGAVVRLERGGTEKHDVVLEDRHGRHRVFPMRPAGFHHEGEPVTLVAPRPESAEPRMQSASGSVRVDGLRARTARQSRIWVEGLHDAELVERVWGHDLRVEGVVVEPLHGVDELPALLERFAPTSERRVGVLVDHLVAGSKESRLATAVDQHHVMLTGHPYVDIWQAVKPSAVGLREWPRVPREESWKDGVCARLGWSDPADGWSRILASVNDFRDLEPPLIKAVEQLIDFLTEPQP